jgi:hypothetical protein
MGIHLIVATICGIIAAAIASHKGRNVAGWFFGGFFLGVIGIIIVACLPNRKVERQYRRQAELERHRLREQLRQQRFKDEAFRRHSIARLDAHDATLGVDTRSQPRLTDGSGDRYLPEEGATAAMGSQPEPPEQALQRMAEAGKAPPGQAESLERQWYYEIKGVVMGPVPEADIRGLLGSKKITGDNLLWTAGLSEWTHAKRFKRFGPEAPS